MVRTDLAKVIGALVALSLVQPGAAADFPDYPVRPASDYAVSIAKAGLTIGVFPVEDLEAQKTYFHTKLAPKGFVPVFIVMQNGSKTDSFLFDKTKITFGTAESTVSTPGAPSKAGKAVAIASLAAGSLAGAIVAMKLISNASVVQQNIVKQELQSKTLSPAGSVHGFLYVPIPKKELRERIDLHIPIKIASTAEILVFDLVF